MRARLKDVADLAGVSVKTVSNVVNGYVHVSAATRERVELAVKELRYQPNLSARSLRSGRSGIIALALPELSASYFSEIAQRVVEAAERKGWTVLVDATGGDHERERVVASGIRAQLIDGLILSPLSLTSADLAQRVDSTPMVLLGERLRREAADHVNIDNVAAAKEATAHLIGLGRRRIAALGAQQSVHSASARLRLKGYRKALEEAGLPYDPELVVSAPAWHRADGARAALSLAGLAQPPDAIFCFNDMLALGALRALRDSGIGIPDQIAVVGFDDIDEGRYSSPSLTTIAPDKAQIATTAIDLLARRLEAKDDYPPVQVTTKYRLVVRESTAGVNPALE